MIGIVDYGLGNVQAILNIFKSLDINAFLASTENDLRKAKRLILPGVGSFDWAMKSLDRSGMRATLDSLVLKERTPILGICVGMQMMANESEEGSLPGLGWINGKVRKINNDISRLPLPHMGWNDVKPRTFDSLFKSFDDTCQFYFLHSYHFAASNDCETLATTEYGDVFSSSVGRNNIFAAQFHPEKSHQWGVQFLQNFSQL